MENKRISTILAVSFVLAITAVVLSFMLVRLKQNRNRSAVIKNVKQVQRNATKPASVQTDSDAKAIEDDLNSISDEDFNANNLSNQNVGL